MQASEKFSKNQDSNSVVDTFDTKQITKDVLISSSVRKRVLNGSYCIIFVSKVADPIICP